MLAGLLEAAAREAKRLIANSVLIRPERPGCRGGGQPARQFQFQKHGQHGRGRRAASGAPVRRLPPARAPAIPRSARARDRHRPRSPPASGRAGASSSAASRKACPRIGLEPVHHIGRGFGERRAVADEAVGAARARIERRARHGENLAALFERVIGGDERAGAFRRLHHHDAARQAGDDAVAAGKWRACGACPSGISETMTPSSRMRS